MTEYEYMYLNFNNTCREFPTFLCAKQTRFLMTVGEEFDQEVAALMFWYTVKRPFLLYGLEVQLWH